MPERRPPRKGDPLAVFVERRRRELGLDQTQLGVKLGDEGRARVTRLENGYLPVGINAAWIAEWARALDVSPEVLIMEGQLHRYLGVPTSPEAAGQETALRAT